MLLTLVLLLGLFLPPRVSAGEVPLQDSLRITRILVEGNLKTHREIILRELEFAPGDWVTEQDLEKAKQRLTNLRLFNHVEFILHRKGRSADLEIRVWERMYIYPTPVLFMNERDWKKWSYGFGVYHANFRGRGETLWVAGWLGYNPGFEIKYANRWFGGPHRLYTEFELRVQTVQNKDPNYRDVGERHRIVNWTFGRRYGIYWYSDITLGYDHVKIPNPVLMWGNGKKADQVFSARLQLKLDTRDIWDYPHRGSLWVFSYGEYHLLGQRKMFQRTKLDLREYRSLSRLIFAFRLLGIVSNGSVPVYHRLYFGYDERLRGHFSQIYSGDMQALISAEVRVPLWVNRDFPLRPLPGYEAYFQNMTYSVYLTFFHDHGAVWEQNKNPGVRDWRQGTGVGLNLVLPYSNVLRLEWAVNEHRNEEFIVDFTMAF